MEKIIEELRFHRSRTFPRAALKEAVANPEETTALLLEEFDAFLADPSIVLSDEDYILHMYGIYLFAEFRVQEAFPRILALVSWPAETLDYTLGDVVTTDLSSILYSTFDGDFEKLKDVIQNPDVDFFVREAALNAYAQLHADGRVEDEEFYAFVRRLLVNRDLMGEWDVATMVQETVMSFSLFEMLDDVQWLYDEDRINLKLAGRYDEFLDYVYYDSARGSSVGYIEDAISELQDWGLFDQTEEMEQERAERMAHLEKELAKEISQTRTAEKVGRNDPCPCGSGKKFKKCCFKKDALLRQKKQEPVAVQERWLEDYPKLEGERKPGEVLLTDHFDEGAIAVDRLVYLALRHRPRPFWEEFNEEKELRARIAYLSEALGLFEEKMAAEALESFEAYDQKHKIHYRSQDWVEEFRRQLVVNGLEDKYASEFEQVGEVLKKFGSAN